MLTIQGFKIRERLANLALEHELPLSIVTNELDFLDAEEQQLVHLAAKCRLIEKDENLSVTGRQSKVTEAVQQQLKRVAGGEDKISKLENDLHLIGFNITNALVREKLSGKADVDQAILQKMELTEIRSLLIRKEEKELAAHEARVKGYNKELLSDEQRRKPTTISDAYFNACRNFNDDKDRNKLLIAAVEKAPVAMLTPEEIAKGDTLLAEQVAADLIYHRRANQFRQAALMLIIGQLEILSKTPTSIEEAQSWNVPPISDQERERIGQGVKLEPVKVLEVAA